MGTHFEIVDSCAKMPSSCWGRYRRVAVLEVVDGYHARAVDEAEALKARLEAERKGAECLGV